MKAVVVGSGGWGTALSMVLCDNGGLIVWKHRANIQRLLAGNENKLSFHRKKT